MRCSSSTTIGARPQRSTCDGVHLGPGDDGFTDVAPRARGAARPPSRPFVRNGRTRRAPPPHRRRRLPRRRRGLRDGVQGRCGNTDRHRGLARHRTAQRRCRSLRSAASPRSALPRFAAAASLWRRSFRLSPARANPVGPRAISSSAGTRREAHRPLHRHDAPVERRRHRARSRRRHRARRARLHGRRRGERPGCARRDARSNPVPPPTSRARSLRRCRGTPRAPSASARCATRRGRARRRRRAARTNRRCRRSSTRSSRQRAAANWPIAAARAALRDELATLPNVVLTPNLAEARAAARLARDRARSNRRGGLGASRARRAGACCSRAATSTAIRPTRWQRPPASRSSASRESPARCTASAARWRWRWPASSPAERRCRRRSARRARTFAPRSRQGVKGRRCATC